MTRPLAGKKIVIAGGSGFLGTMLSTALAKQGAEIVILSRRPRLAHHENCQVCNWDGAALGSWTEQLSGAYGLVNLAGQTVNCIKTPETKDEIMRSRVDSTRVLGRAMASVPAPPPVWVQMGTAHIYGDPTSARCGEDAATGYGFAPDVGRAWESAFKDGLLASQRGVLLRTSFVLGRNRGAGGGALDVLRTLVRYGLGGRVASGRQGMSWLHERDFCEMVSCCLCDASYAGIYNATSPQPVSQADFMEALRRVSGAKFGLPASEWMVRLGARWVLRTDPELALYGRYVIPSRFAAAGFQFKFPDLNDALHDLLRS